jgi:hypothetical protein
LKSLAERNAKSGKQPQIKRLCVFLQKMFGCLALCFVRCLTINKGHGQEETALFTEKKLANKLQQKTWEMCKTVQK